MAGEGFFGDATPDEAWAMLTGSPAAVLIDVRTAPEWNFVGVPDLSQAGAPLLQVEWQSYPSGQPNPDFVANAEAALQAAHAGRDTPVLFLCRSGARSAAAAGAMSAAGYTRCYNVTGGFEGVRDRDGHRGNLEGWKAANLPWVQS